MTRIPTLPFRSFCSHLAVTGLLVGTLMGGCTTTTPIKKDGPRPEPPKETWREQKPTAGPAPALVLPTFQQEVLPNGLTLIVAPQPDLPIVSIRAAVKTGSIDDTNTESGLAYLTFDMLDEGAGKRDAMGIADAFGDLGTSVFSSAGQDVSSVGTNVLARHANAATSLLASLLREPSFNKKDFERVQSRHLASLQRRASDPNSAASDVFEAALYGSDHPYGRPVVGNAATVTKLGVQQAKKFWQNHVGPKNTALIFAGAITLDEAKAIANQHFGTWKNTVTASAAPKNPPPAHTEGKTRILLVNQTGAPQTIMRVGKVLLKRGDPAEEVHLVVNRAFGGAFTSRLNLKLREEKSWTYGARSVMDGRLGMGPLVVTANIKQEFSADALAETLRQLDALAAATTQQTHAITDDELQRAKLGSRLALPARFETLTALSASAADLFAYGLPLDEYQQFAAGLDAVTIDNIDAVSPKAFATGDMIAVLVGDRTLLEPALKALNIGSVTVVDGTGKPIP